jgi:hypothetical protein
MDWINVRVGTGVHHDKCGRGTVTIIDPKKQKCTVLWSMVGPEEYTFDEIMTDGRFKFLMWVSTSKMLVPA